MNSSISSLTLKEAEKIRYGDTSDQDIKDAALEYDYFKKTGIDKSAEEIRRIRGLR